MRRRFKIGTVLALMLFASALTCLILYFTFFAPIAEDLTFLEKGRTYAELKSLIEELYIGEYDAEEIDDVAYSALVEALGDQWSYYMTADEYTEYLDYSDNQYAGLGITVQKDADSGGLKIMRIAEETPAEEAGLHVGDIILTIDGIDVTEMDLSDATALVKREPGASISLQVCQLDGTQRDVTAQCEIIYTDPVHYEMLEGNIGYIQMTNFESGLADGCIQAVDDLQAQGANGLIFDLRNNGGGKVSELTTILDYLLPEGDIFVSIDEDGNETVTTSDAAYVDLPMVVLVNENTYSAAEFFAAVLDEYGVAELVGQPTTGKGRSQVTIPLSDGSALHISSKEYVTPNRVSLYDQGGLTPDYVVDMTDDQEIQLYYGNLLYTDDPQLQKAIEQLQK